MAPSHSLREGINGIVCDRLAREGIVHGPALHTERRKPPAWAAFPD